MPLAWALRIVAAVGACSVNHNREDDVIELDLSFVFHVCRRSICGFRLLCQLGSYLRMFTKMQVGQ